MGFSLKNGKVLWAAALLAMPATALAQGNATDSAVANSTTTTDAGLNEATANLSSGEDTTVVMTDDIAANDMALANSVPRERDDRDFPWGLLGLLGLAGLLGRKKDDDIHVDARDNRRNA